MTDTVLKVYHKGRQQGRYIVFFKTAKAKELYKSLNLIVVEGAFNAVAGNNDEDTLRKVRSFLTRNNLTFKEITIK